MDFNDAAFRRAYREHFPAGTIIVTSQNGEYEVRSQRGQTIETGYAETHFTPTPSHEFPNAGMVRIDVFEGARKPNYHDDPHPYRPGAHVVRTFEETRTAAYEAKAETVARFAAGESLTRRHDQEMVEEQASVENEWQAWQAAAAAFGVAHQFLPVVNAAAATQPLRDAVQQLLASWSWLPLALEQLNTPRELTRFPNGKAISAFPAELGTRDRNGWFQFSPDVHQIVLGGNVMTGAGSKTLNLLLAVRNGTLYASTATGRPWFNLGFAPPALLAQLPAPGLPALRLQMSVGGRVT